MNNQNPARESSVEKALGILLAFNADDRELGTTEISLKTGLPKSTTCRLIKALVNTSFLRQNPVSKKYMFGSSAYQIGTAAVRAMDTRLLAIAYPHLEELARKTGESVALEMLSGIDVVLAMQVEGPSHLRFNFQQGEVVPINVAAGAKVILSGYDESFLDTFLHRKFKKFNDKTITSKDEYRRLLAQVRKKGVAYDHGERYQDIHAMAVPINKPNGPPTAAVIIAGPATRLSESYLESVKHFLLDTADNISKNLFSYDA